VEPTRRMILSAVPLPPSELKTLFQSGEGSIRRLLERPPTVRASGWDLETGGDAQTVRGQLVRVSSGDRKTLELYRDGTLLFVCRADDWFLAWASPRGRQRINPLALVEVTLSFMNFYHHVLGDLIQQPKEIQVRVDFRDLHAGGQKTSLVPHALGTFAQVLEMEVHEAPDNDLTLAKKFSAKDFEPAVAAYTIVREIYLWFGIDDDKIPYVNRDSSTPMVDIDSIRAAR